MQIETIFTPTNVSLERAMALHRGEEFDFDESFNRLFTWCQETLASL